MARQYILGGLPTPTFVNETGTRRYMLPGVYFDETVSQAYSVSLTEAASASDLISATAQFLGVMAEAATAADALSATAQFLAALNEAASATDAIAATAQFLSALTEAASTTDTVAAQAAFLSVLSEAASATDAPSATAQFFTSLSETATGADAIQAGVGYLVSLTETAGATESLTAAAGFVVALTEATSATDLIAASAGYLAAITEAGTASDAITAAAQFLGALAEAADALDFFTIPLPPPLVRLAKVRQALRIAATWAALRIQPVRPATRIVSVPIMSIATPVQLDVMRDNTADTRGLDLSKALQVEGDTVASISGITVVRTDGKVVTGADLTITPAGKAVPWISANSAGTPNVAVNWWQGVDLGLTATSDQVDYIVTVAFVTTAGRDLEYDAAQTVSRAIG